MDTGTSSFRDMAVENHGIFGCAAEATAELLPAQLDPRRYMNRDTGSHDGEEGLAQVGVAVL
jgi:hypothetical protein